MTDPRIEARHKARVIEETEEDKQRRIAFRAVAKTPEGQWVLRWFMEVLKRKQEKIKWGSKCGLTQKN